MASPVGEVKYRASRLDVPSGTRAILDPVVPQVQRAVAEPSAALLGRREHARRILARLLVALAALQVLDLASTLLLLSIGGTEANPVSAWLLSHGVEAFVAVKLVLAGALLAFVPLLRRPQPADGLRTAMWTCASFDAIYLVAVASNVAQFLLFA